jgi:hypothetical protein
LFTYFFVEPGTPNTGGSRVIGGGVTFIGAMMEWKSAGPGWQSLW